MPRSTESIRALAASPVDNPHNFRAKVLARILSIGDPVRRQAEVDKVLGQRVKQQKRVARLRLLALKDREGRSADSGEGKSVDGEGMDGGVDGGVANDGAEKRNEEPVPVPVPAEEEKEDVDTDSTMDDEDTDDLCMDDDDGDGDGDEDYSGGGVGSGSGIEDEDEDDEDDDDDGERPPRTRVRQREYVIILYEIDFMILKCLYDCFAPFTSVYFPDKSSPSEPQGVSADVHTSTGAAALPPPTPADTSKLSWIGCPAPPRLRPGSLWR
jgi:hypothetical protein